MAAGERRRVGRVINEGGGSRSAQGVQPGSAFATETAKEPQLDWDYPTRAITSARLVPRSRRPWPGYGCADG
jgi:hypothetical protein